MNSTEKARPEFVLVRHGETEWSASGKHTGTTDVPLTEIGREAARQLGDRLAGHEFAVVWTSPRIRAKETCELAGFGSRAEVVDDVAEWNYGEYEGRKTDEIRAERPGWTVWNGGCPGGEDVAEVGARADRALQRLRSLLVEGRAQGALGGDALLFSHGHFLRVLAARWIGFVPEKGARFGLSTGAICVLGWERETPVIRVWNDVVGRV